MKGLICALMICMVFVPVATATASLGGMDNRPSVVIEGPSNPDGTPRLWLKAGTTIGNHTYLPINLLDIPSNRTTLILQILRAFEQENPKLEVTSWSIEKDQPTADTTGYIYGLWINHRPKK